MPRRQKAPRRRRRRGTWSGRVLLAIVLIGAGYYITQWWLHRQPLSNNQTSATPENGSHVVTPQTPEFYGTRSTMVALAGGDSARMVDAPDSTAPLALILPASGDDPAEWAGVQSTLEQFGVGSMVVSPAVGDAALQSAVTLLLEATRRRSQPIALIASGSAIDRAIELGGESSLADRALVLLTPAPRINSTLDGLISRTPAWLRHQLDTRQDTRLDSWRGRVLVARAKDDTRMDALSANALIAGRKGREVLVVPGKGFRRAPAHPDQESWRLIADFVRGVTNRRHEITVAPPDSLPLDP